MHRARFGSLLVCALALACDRADAEPAPFCTGQFGCPDGTRCVDDSRCEIIGDASVVSIQPRFPPRFGPIVLPPRQPDAGSDLDGGDVFDRDGGTDRCPGSAVDCDGQCVDLRSDRANCGRCGLTCIATEDCLSGVCCSAALSVCGVVCVDIFSDALNCGACGFACDLDSSCILGACVPR